MTAALELARAGWCVFPCQPRGPKAKSPLTEHGHLDATSDADMNKAWWTTWPEAMIGAPVPLSLLVLDIDPRNGGSFEALEQAAGPIADTLTAWSGRGDGGRHLYFERPYGELTSTRLPKGIDLKSNGYTILPPSVHPASGEPYRWELREVAPLTPQLRELLRLLPVLRTHGRQTGVNGSGLVRLVLALKDGERNRGLFWAACRAAEGGILNQLEPDLISAACSAGLPEPEARRVLASAARKASAQR